MATKAVDLKASLKEFFGFDTFKGMQEEVISTIMEGDDCFVIMPTGAGKSTIIALLTRFYEPEKGEIFVDGIPLTDYSKAYLRGRIGAVLQNPFLFSTTIKQNISYALPDAAENDIIDAAKAASIHEIMHVFANGYDTLVGEEGVTLSGGQKQRVALARTLLENPDILILDDATSAVDTETEEIILNELRSLPQSPSMVLVSHRISTLRNCEQIIVLADGEIVEMGSPEDLMKQKGVYYETYLQQLNEDQS